MNIFDEEDLFGINPRDKVFPNGEWEITVQLRGDGGTIGTPMVLRYTDSYLASEPRNVGYLIAAAINERAASFKPKTRRTKKTL